MPWSGLAPGIRQELVQTLSETDSLLLAGRCDVPHLCRLGLSNDDRWTGVGGLAPMGANHQRTEFRFEVVRRPAPIGPDLHRRWPCGRFGNHGTDHTGQRQDCRLKLLDSGQRFHHHVVYRPGALYTTTSRQWRCPGYRCQMRIFLSALCVAGAMTSCTSTTPDLSVAGPVDGRAAHVERVLDGDSFLAVVDGDQVEVRIIGINAPERDECHGDAARARLVELIEDHEVSLVADLNDDDTDRFGRWLRYVYVNGTLVSTTMAAEGHAVALQGGSSREADIVEASDQAFARAFGMWGPTACGEAASDPVTITRVEYDPPGRDRENPSEEWVEVTNQGTQPADLSNWILRDETSTHRYRFTQGEVIEPGESLRIRSGCGEDRRLDRYWCADDALWSNGGDTAILQTAAGTVVSRLRYDGDY